MNKQESPFSTEVSFRMTNSEVVIELLALLRQARSMRDAVNGG